VELVTRNWKMETKTRTAIEPELDLESKKQSRIHTILNPSQNPFIYKEKFRNEFEVENRFENSPAAILFYYSLSNNQQ